MAEPHLRATRHSTAWSGFGLVKNCHAGSPSAVAADVWTWTLATLPSPNASGPHGTAPENHWDFASWKAATHPPRPRRRGMTRCCFVGSLQPDAVVINLRTNDDLQANPGYIPAFNATYLALVLATSKRYTPRAHFFLAVGPLADTYLNKTV